MDINNKIALITGGANGIGFSYAEELLRNGAAHVAILDLVSANGEEAAAKLNAEFGTGKAIFIPCDVTKPQQLEDGFKKTVDTFKGLDIVINNAGILNDAEFDLMININVNAVVRGNLLGFQYMGKDKGGKGGTIVNIASIAALMPMYCAPVYIATKHAVLGLSRSFANPLYYNEKGVRVLTMCPGVTDTPLISESTKKLLSIVDIETVEKEMSLLPTQIKDNVALGMIHILKNAPNGSVWVSEGGEPVYEIRFSERLGVKV